MDKVTFTLNGTIKIIDSSLDPNTTLNSYIRNYAKLKGTKAMCHEGGCGACIVSVRARHPVTKDEKIFAVNSCLVSVLSCHGWSITTVEGLGNRRDGYHSVQSRLAGFNGSQCGFCSPGWVMNMYSLLESSDYKLSMKEVENSFAGNMCRCTGYRPILDAFKSFAIDCDKRILNRIKDIEDMTTCKKSCSECSISNECQTLKLELDGVKWFRVETIDGIFDVFDKEGTESYMLVAGNTARGVYEMSSSPSVMIDITGVSELKTFSTTNKNLIIGSGMTLNEAMDVFKEVASKNDAFKYLHHFYNHLDLVAHMPVRNIGTIAGNLSIKHAHLEFPSDVFLLLESVGATLTIVSKGRKETQVSLSQYLTTDLRGKIITQIYLPLLESNTVFCSYKIMPRAQNAHAHINAGFLFKFVRESTIVEKAVIVFGGISSTFIHATATEKLLIGKDLSVGGTLEAALIKLSGELIPEDAPPEPSPEYRKRLALGLFYKFVLNVAKAKISETLKSGAEELHRSRPVSSGRQTYETDQSFWPLGKPMPKMDALVQCAGEAEYINDIPISHDEVHIAFVLSTVHRGVVDEIDGGDALKCKGVITLLTSKDIPGENNFTPVGKMLFLNEIEEILVSGEVKYNGQPIALVVAESPELAQKAAKLVKVTYKNVPKSSPVLTIKDALKDKDRTINYMVVEAKHEGNDVNKVIEGSLDLSGQYHYTMETHTCACIPKEDGIDVYSATQWIDITQVAISRALKIPQSQINMVTRRLGGGYGTKISRASLIACATALTARLLNRPARFVLPLADTMKAIGKRNPFNSSYEVSVNGKGEIQRLNNTYYADFGCSHNENVALFASGYFSSCYDSSRWSFSANSALTDTASNTWCRAPGSTEAIALTETIMEQISTELGLDPLKVRLANMEKKDSPLPELIDRIKKDAEYEIRMKTVKHFNKTNRWKKRGISLVPISYPIIYLGFMPAVVSIYHGDGTVTVSHGGIEMGQGLNTKVAQVCAHTLGVPLKDVTIRPTDSHTAPNSSATAASIGSEVCCYATINACKKLLNRLEPIKNTMPNPTWLELISEAFQNNVSLSAESEYSITDELKAYSVHGVTVTEVEVDVLTGNHNVLRVDLLEDTGYSMSPEVDVGQVEGAFVMGLGYWTSEALIYDKMTGELLTNRTWNYKPPGAKDIPIDFRVYFRRNAANPHGVLGSKATGEPPLCMAVSVVFAIRYAVTSARVDSGKHSNDWYNIYFPYSPENVLMAIDNDLRDFKLQV